MCRAFSREERQKNDGASLPYSMACVDPGSLLPCVVPEDVNLGSHFRRSTTAGVPSPALVSPAWGSFSMLCCWRYTATRQPDPIGCDFDVEEIRSTR